MLIAEVHSEIQPHPTHPIWDGHPTFLAFEHLSQSVAVCGSLWHYWTTRRPLVSTQFGGIGTKSVQCGVVSIFSDCHGRWNNNNSSSERKTFLGSVQLSGSVNYSISILTKNRYYLLLNKEKPFQEVFNGLEVFRSQLHQRSWREHPLLVKDNISYQILISDFDIPLKVLLNKISIWYKFITSTA